MFTGIIEELGIVRNIEKEHSNIHFVIEASFTKELAIDQSIAHDGVCLTVVDFPSENMFKVTAISETIQRTRLSEWKIADTINLERAMKLGDRLDGHLVQGHVDTVGICTKITDMDGSHKFYFNYTSPYLTVEKGSITINGVSLTVVDSGYDYFSVAIIPYTLEHTSFKFLKEGDAVNLEFDIIGKYFQKQMEVYTHK